MKKLLVLLLVLAMPVSGWAQAPAGDAEADDLPLDMTMTAEDDAFLFEDEEILEVWDPIEPCTLPRLVPGTAETSRKPVHSTRK